MNPVFYNYFSNLEEFLSYLKNDRFVGSGIISIPEQKEPYLSETDCKARLEWKEGQLIVFLEGKKNSKSFLIPLNSTDTNGKKRNKLEFLPDFFRFQNGEEGFSVRLQPLDLERIHLQIDSKAGLEFSGILTRISSWKKWF
ncbi:hypothetical protein [Leptospira kirschneri]|uniref:Uncharacterized protein n=1 Tax=Leptospira kirschneri str. 200802841 TaxID=1193047 RepID=A0A828Y4R0_9LEPT|nr:hypothetical protein [Leptospira kirschneri]EJO70792.1 hypothetical protein LEP1GSC044_2425 [Leptospira kirschneri serovar Grippotyphosa str. RM52]EKO52812.1 hypothetical protein LEP1GSC131_2493 [Leptospira kirschneri str. 200802841]EKQ81848.1 hypothetical protein LEP1GSC064_0067 [Leptospira kirschneri serovar Grippotyphosa str. Moskva]EKR09735.1 hypothetical protein LEP1GSC122_3084 [Leptospira kirschneri serovar Valbuzzi str. 200702274]EMK01166.1 hypothetical protein LEP1GSC176_1348 [Lepto